MTSDGGIPLLSRVIDGGAAEISQITGTMNSLRAIAGPKEFLLIADSKLVSYGNITALIKAGTPFIAAAPASKVDDAVYAALDLEAAAVVDYSPVRDANIPAVISGAGPTVLALARGDAEVEAAVALAPEGWNVLRLTVTGGAEIVPPR